MVKKNVNLAMVKKNINLSLVKKVDPLALPIVAMSGISIAGTVLTPLLLDHPILLMLLSPRVLFMGLAAGSMGVIPFIVLATLRLSIIDPFHFLLGRRHGPKAVARLGRIGRWMAKPNRHHRTVALLLLTVRPIGRHLMWAGSQGVRMRWVAIIDILSTVVYCFIVHKTATSF